RRPEIITVVHTDGVETSLPEQPSRVSSAVIATVPRLGKRRAGAMLLWGWPMPKALLSSVFLGVMMLALAACGDRATLPVEAGLGPEPTLPAPHPTPLPTVNIAPAKGWPA